mmetsp:Transcript_24236/g.53820  ORF Transcript_24236/g.53820 Transcript_24236/m.53820 type:complete len:210 (-) Transcript_24236:1880-2509(-)
MAGSSPLDRRRSLARLRPHPQPWLSRQSCGTRGLQVRRSQRPSDRHLDPPKPPRPLRLPRQEPEQARRIVACGTPCRQQRGRLGARLRVQHMMLRQRACMADRRAQWGITSGVTAHRPSPCRRRFSHPWHSRRKRRSAVDRWWRRPCSSLPRRAQSDLADLFRHRRAVCSMHPPAAPSTRRPAALTAQRLGPRTVDRFRHPWRSRRSRR